VSAIFKDGFKALEMEKEAHVLDNALTQTPDIFVLKIY
jgi:hypothetical protein